MSETPTHQITEWPLPGHDLLSAETQAMLERMHAIAPESAVSVAGMRIAVEQRKNAISEQAHAISHPPELPRS